jgi:hypothetical protein
MIRVSISMAILVAAATWLPAQQPNLPTASMIVNGQAGPPFPISNVPVPRGLASSLRIDGLPNAIFVVANSPSLLASGLPWGGGLIDISLTGMSYTLNGLTNGLYRTDGTGVYSVQIPIPATLAINSSRCFQAMVEDPSSPVGARLSAASRLVIVQGVSIVNLILAGNTSQNVSLTPYGIQIPYYSQNYSSIDVASDGLVCFGGGNTDFTPTPTEFQGGLPRIAGFWTDLEPQYGGTIEVHIDQSTTPALVSVRWTNIREWAGGGSPHTFRVDMTAAPIGDIVIRQSPFNSAPGYDVLVGIAAGSNIGISTQINFSNFIGGFEPGTVNRSYWEWFGLTSMIYYTAGFNNPWDLPGVNLHFYATGAGTSQPTYSLTAYY